MDQNTSIVPTGNLMDQSAVILFYDEIYPIYSLPLQQPELPITGDKTVVANDSKVS